MADQTDALHCNARSRSIPLLHPRSKEKISKHEFKPTALSVAHIMILILQHCLGAILSSGPFDSSPCLLVNSSLQMSFDQACRTLNEIFVFSSRHLNALVILSNLFSLFSPVSCILLLFAPLLDRPRMHGGRGAGSR
eukprot:766377-Hanusia_phi.AAC.5